MEEGIINSNFQMNGCVGLVASFLASSDFEEIAKTSVFLQVYSPFIFA